VDVEAGGSDGLVTHQLHDSLELTIGHMMFEPVEE
jgi:hypothetical protein